MTDKTKKVLDAKKTEHEDRIYSYEIYINDSDETIESIEISMSAQGRTFDDQLTIKYNATKDQVIELTLFPTEISSLFNYTTKAGITNSPIDFGEDKLEDLLKKAEKKFFEAKERMRIGGNERFNHVHSMGDYIDNF